MPLYVALLLAGALSSTAVAQDADRTLFWRRLDVTAQLDADGRLHVRELHAMVFDGAWNGGERTFNIRRGQRLELRGLARIGADGVARPLTSGGLEHVDHFDWTDARTLRWRSRLPSDPPFSFQEIRYQIDYTLANILVPGGDGYRLHHDFAFPNRSGVIETFTLAFDADPVWRAETGLPLSIEQRELVPGAAVLIDLPLRYTGTGAPAAVRHPVPLPVRLTLLFALLAGLYVLLRSFFAHQAARGRFAPLVPPEEIDEAWLREHVFVVPPEVVGAAWDTKTAAPEVAAMIARMVQEKKLASRVVVEGKKKPVLHLERLVERDVLTAEEQRLIDALFSGGDTHTDTETIRARYKESGFDPAALIRKSLERRVKALLPNERTPAGSTNVLLTVLAAMVAVGAAIAAFLAVGEPSALLIAPIAALAFGLLGLVLALLYRASVIDLKGKAVRLAAYLLLAAAPTGALILGFFEAGATAFPPGAFLMGSLVVLVLSITFLVLRAARTRETTERLELRRTLAAARAFFERELARKEPALDDAWFPYLMAFGLGGHVDRWFRSFSAAHATAALAGTHSHGSGSSWSGGGPLFGGGGGFGGGGAGRSWAAVTETFSAGVAAPSSSGGGGGGGGGGSSGGGGGGGW